MQQHFQISWVILPKEDVDRQNNLLIRFGFDIENELLRFSADEIISQMRRDKKAVAWKIKFVLPEKIGSMATINGMYEIDVE